MTKKEGMTCTMLLDKVAELKAKGWNDEKILEFFFHLFTTQEINAKELRMMVEAIGYQLSDDFIKELEKEGIEY